MLFDGAEQNIANPAATESPSPTILQSRVGIDDFDIISTLGKGNSAKVLLAENKHSKKLYAIKILRKEILVEYGETSSPKTEKSILKLATEEKHPFVVHSYGTFQSDTRLYFILEYIPGGDLMWHIQNKELSQTQAQ